MPERSKYLFLALPSSITPSGHRDDAINSIQSAVTTNLGAVSPFNIPAFNVGTLDALIQQSEELGKLEGQCKGVVSKVSDALKNVLDGDDEKIAMHKNVSDKPLEQYIKTFSWRKDKYRTDKPIRELMDLLQKEANSIDNDVRSKYNQWTNLRQQSQNLGRRQTGNLSTKSLAAIVSPDMLISDSEHLETHLVAVPNNNVKDFNRTYETVSAMVVPRSAYWIAKDEEFNLYSVAVFKKHSSEFVHKCRERKWIPRDFKFEEGGKDKEVKEMQDLEAQEKRVWGEALRLGRTGWSEAVMCLIHIIALRCFVESVLRYGLPMDFVAASIKVDAKKAERAKRGLDAQYNYLAGNAFGRDKKGRINKDQGMSQNDTMGGAVGGDANGYEGYVYYEIEVD